jgi:hypothetical protein
VIVFNLACEQRHPFEGWFGSAADMASQQARGLLSCPVCGSSSIEKQLSAPRLNLLPSHAGHDVADRDGTPTRAVLAPEHAQLREMIRQVVAQTEDVGQRFPEEARRIHYKEAPLRSIRGVASPKEAEALSEEGIEVAYLPFPVIDQSELN